MIETKKIVGMICSNRRERKAITLIYFSFRPITRTRPSGICL
jgi:hypothetical protein